MRGDDGALARDLWVAWRGSRPGDDVEGARVPDRGATHVFSFYDVFAGPGEHAAWNAWRIERAGGTQGHPA